MEINTKAIIAIQCYTIKEVAEMFKSCTKTIKAEFERGKLGGFYLGNELRFRQEHIDEYTKTIQDGKSVRERALEELVSKLSKENTELRVLINRIEAVTFEASARKY
jgi:hypothetical protein